MNKGVTACHGDYVLFMNGGDSFYDKNVIAKFENIAPVFVIGTPKFQDWVAISIKS